MIKINSQLLKEQMALSKESARQRQNHNFHHEAVDPLQRMLNSMQPGTYLQPHKHQNPDKREVFLALTGRFVVVQFDDIGSIADHMILDPEKLDYAAEMAARTYHTIICLEPNSIIYELKDGPYDPSDDKNFASWAPQEGTPGCDEYLRGLLQKLNIPIPS